MIHTCFDAAASSLSGRVVFKWPYPDKDWQYNGFYLEAMEITNKALNLFKTPESQWQAEHNEFFVWVWNQTQPQVNNG